MLCSFVSVVGGGFFLATALFVEGDRNRAENYAPSGEEWYCFAGPTVYTDHSIHSIMPNCFLPSE